MHSQKWETHILIVIHVVFIAAAVLSSLYPFKCVPTDRSRLQNDYEFFCLNHTRRKETELKHNLKIVRNHLY